VPCGWLPLDALLEACAATPAPARAADAIFHIGHCGSTLLSRLLDSWADVQGLREPLPLRTLAQVWSELDQPIARLSASDADRTLRALWAAWSRPLPGTNKHAADPDPEPARTVVKATSSCNGLAAPLLDAHPTLRALLLDLPLRPYLATLLKSPASVQDAAAAAGERLLSLRALSGDDRLVLHELSLPQQCAMGWLAERLRFAALHRAYPGRVLRVDFEHLLAAPEATLGAIAAHLALPAAGMPEALASPAWGRYSKAQDHGYSGADRAHDLALAYRRHAADIAEGESWVARFLQRHPAYAADADSDADARAAG